MQRKILIASDEPLLSELLNRHLHPHGYQLTVTGTGEDISGTVCTVNPDLVLLDIAMPRMDGLEICLNIRRHSPVAIIMLTTWGAGPNRLRGLNLASASYLTEPFDVDELYRRIEETLARNNSLGDGGHNQHEVNTKISINAVTGGNINRTEYFSAN